MKVIPNINNIYKPYSWFKIPILTIKCSFFQKQINRIRVLTYSNYIYIYIKYKIQYVYNLLYNYLKY